MQAKRDADRQSERAPRGLRIALWILALLLMLSAGVYQRLTGPTHPMRGDYAWADQSYAYKLKRSGWSHRDTEIRLPAPREATGTLYCKRFKTGDPFQPLPLRREGESLVADLPRQPAAGKLEYYLLLDLPSGPIRIPAAPDEAIVIRHKDHVPLAVLLPHIAMMFLAVLIGMRAGLAALFDPAGMRSLAWLALGGMTLGGMILGPIVQKLAFGAYWTGWPNGKDLTDNKMLIMWIVWLLACAVLSRWPRSPWRAGRMAVVLAALVMSLVYVVPHSMRGSELDYAKVDQGIAPDEAIGTSDR